MSTAIENTATMPLGGFYTGSWAGESLTALGEPDCCYFCGNNQIAGFITDNDARFGVCEKHKNNSHPHHPRKGHFVAYPKGKSGLQVVDIKAKDVRRGMVVLLDFYNHGQEHLRAVTKVDRKDKTCLNLHFDHIILPMPPNAVIKQAISRFD